MLRRLMGTVRSTFTHLVDLLKDRILRKHVGVDSYNVLNPAKAERIRFEIERKTTVSEDLSNITIPPIYEYNRVEPTTFETQRIEDFDNKEASVKSPNQIPRSVFNALESAEIEGCNCENLSLSSGNGKFQKKKNNPGIERTNGGQYDVLHLTLPSLYPRSAFDPHRLLDFSQGRSLFPFQKDGVAFLIERDNALLADDMGLGKSVQAIAAARLLFEANVAGSCLVVCPKSVLVDWESRFEEWAPDLRVTRICGSGSSRRKLWDAGAQVYLVTYDTLREDVFTGRNDEVAKLNFDLVVLDEVQRIKNSTTKTFKAIRKVEGDIRWGLSGTPLENRIEDLTTIFSYLKPGLFKTVEVNDAPFVKSSVKPFFLRRNKSAVLKDLPKKSHTKIMLDLETKQRAAYTLAEREGVTSLKEKGRKATVTHVIALISKLKQICNIEPASGESCKLEYLQDALENLHETGEKMLVFSQYPMRTLKLIGPRLARYNPLMYHGSLTTKQRGRVLEQFEEDDGVRVLLMSLKAGGLGLTLTAANYVTHFDSWWNPAVMSQAEDRTHRIGQKRHVFVTSLITRNTVEGRIQKILEEKRNLFKEIVEDISDTGLTKMLTEKDLFGLFGLHREKGPTKSETPLYA